MKYRTFFRYDRYRFIVLCVVAFTFGIQTLFADDAFIPQFADATAKANLPYETVFGNAEKDWIIDVNGSGVGIFDYDLDGDLDLYLVNGSRRDLKPGDEKPTNKLFRNEGNWRFTDATFEAGVQNFEWGVGCCVGDVDNDGDPDLFVSTWGPDYLYINNGDGTFTNRAKEAGIHSNQWSAGSAFGDYDLDGDLDLYVTNYVDFGFDITPRRGELDSCVLAGTIPVHCGPKGLPAIPDYLYRNNGDGTFTDISETSGIRNIESAFGLGVLWLDVNTDGYPDLYVTNDQYPNYLFQNMGDGTFMEVGLELGLSYNAMGEAQSGMGVECGDMDGDGFEDITVLNYAQDYNTFYRNEGDGYFIDATKEANMYFDTFHQLAWSVVLLDVDFDGDLDQFIANGHVMPQIDQTSAKIGYKQRNQLFLNNGKGVFANVPSKVGEVFQVKLSSRGSAFGDLDGDGDQDIVVNNMDAPVTIYENLGGSGNHWIGIDLVGTECNRNAFGSWVTIHTPTKTYKRYHRGAFGYASQSEFTLRFGLGQETTVEWIKVQWPGGASEQFPAQGIDRVVKLTQGQGKTE